MSRVDVMTVLAPGQTMAPDARDALQRQGDLLLTHYRLRDARRWGEGKTESIARARNEMKLLGSSPYLMFVDSDVALPPLGIQRLLLGLQMDATYGALGIDYQGMESGGHVAMGAVLFRRSVLDRIQFRWQPGICECACCCEDVRALGYRMAYLPGLKAKHLRGAE
jgi:hypothetical protein